MVSSAVSAGLSSARAAVTVYLPGTVCQPSSQTCQVRAGNGMRTVTVSPGCASTGSNPASQRSGRSGATPAGPAPNGCSPIGPTYTWTTSRPTRAPVLVSVTTASPADTASVSYSQVV